MVTTRKSVKQEEVLARLKKQKPAVKYESLNGRTGPDAVLTERGKHIVIEAIAYSDRTAGGISKHWKNQSDFWKAFSQAISRLNGNGVVGTRPDLTVIALPDDFLRGWKARMDQFGSTVWKKIGKAFPELEIWFVGNKRLLQYTWNAAFNASDDDK